MIKTYTNWILASLVATASVTAFGQGTSNSGPPASNSNNTNNTQAGLTQEQKDALKAWQAAKAKQAKDDKAAIIKGEKDGVEVRIKDIAHFRGVRSNQLKGFGIVVGLEGTGDTKKTPFTQQLLANALRDWGTAVDATQLGLKNIATVTVTCDLPPFAAPGTSIDVTVQSVGDAKSLQGGFLLSTPLYGANDNTKAIVVAQGGVSIGGFQAGASGSSVQKNHLNVGRLPGGGIIEASVATQVVFNGKMYLEVEQADFTTVQRLATKLGEVFPYYSPKPINGVSIELTLPSEKNSVEAIAEIEATTVFADIPAVVVINERTGTVIVGGNVKVGPAIVIKGSLQVRIDTINDVSQPPPFSSGGTTKEVSNSQVSADENKVQMALIAPNTTVADLARIFSELRVSATDIIAILQELKSQGALKARIKTE